MQRRLILLTLAVLTCAAGCGKKESLVPIDQFPKALVGLEAKTEEVFAAFAAGDPKAADQPIHEVFRDFNLIDRLAEPAGLTNDQQAALKQATAQLLDAYQDLHTPMHQAVFPEDFDFEPIRKRLFDGLKAIRGALPAAFVGQLQAAKEARDRETRSPSVEPTPDESNDDPGTTGPGDEATENPEVDPAPDTGAAIAPAPFRIAAKSAGDRAAPLCPSVMLWDEASYELAPERVNRAAELMAGAPPDRRWVQLVPTLHARLNADRTIADFGVMRDRGESWRSPDNFEPATGALAGRFRDAFAAAIGQAVRRGMSVAILPHLDPAGGPVEAWRNVYDFAPDAVIGTGSYESLLIEPLAAAIETEATSDTRIDLTLSGEMGRSLFEHPREYLALAERLHGRFADNPRTAGVRLGAALNWSGVVGSLDATSIDREAVAELFAGFDFVSFSCYAPVGVPPRADDFRLATSNFLAELQSLGVVLSPQTRLVYAEVGVGGGGASLEAIAAKPYDAQGMPSGDPWSSPERRDFRVAYHRALCDYLARGEIEKAFVWSEGPWDPQGIADRRFRDETITKLIDSHNKRGAVVPGGVQPAASVGGSTEGLVD